MHAPASVNSCCTAADDCFPWSCSDFDRPWPNCSTSVCCCMAAAASECVGHHCSWTVEWTRCLANGYWSHRRQQLHYYCSTPMYCRIVVVAAVVVDAADSAVDCYCSNSPNMVYRLSPKPVRPLVAVNWPTVNRRIRRKKRIKNQLQLINIAELTWIGRLGRSVNFEWNKISFWAYLIMLILFSHRFLFCLTLALVSVILEPNFHLKCQPKETKIGLKFIISSETAEVKKEKNIK